MFIRSNMSRPTPVSLTIRDGPTDFRLGTFNNPNYATVPAINRILFDIDPSEPWTAEDGAFMVGYASAPQSAGINFFDGPWRRFGSIPGDSVTPATPRVLPDPWIGAPPGPKRWGRAVLVRADGRTATPRIREFVET